MLDMVGPPTVKFISGEPGQRRHQGISTNFGGTHHPPVASGQQSRPAFSG